MKAAIVLVALGLMAADNPVKYSREREVAPGYFASSARLPEGWIIWRWETRSRTICEAYKTAPGRSLPSPLGVQDAMIRYNSTPWVRYRERNAVGLWDIGGRYPGEAKTEYRVGGERFWEPVSPNLDLAPLDGKVIDVHVVTARYPDSWVGSEDQVSSISLKGARIAMNAVSQCSKADQEPSLPRAE